MTTAENALKAAAAEIEFLATKDKLVVTDHDRHRRLLASLRIAIDAHLAGMGEPVAWWNGWRYGQVIEPVGDPSFSAQENTWHDIPLYAGVNPCNTPHIDLAAVREVIAAVRKLNWAQSPLVHKRLEQEIDKLEATMGSV